MGSAGEPHRILHFWRDLEAFALPAIPDACDSDATTSLSTLHQPEPLPWRNTAYASTLEHVWVHTVYVGVADTDELARLVLQTVFPASELTQRERERTRGSGWLAAFVVDESGRPQAASYVPTTLAHGLAALRANHSLDDEPTGSTHASDAFAARARRFEAVSSDHLAGLDWNDLDAEHHHAAGFLTGPGNRPALDGRVVIRSHRVPCHERDEGLAAAYERIRTAAFNDLDRLIVRTDHDKPFGAALDTYLGAALPEDRRIDVLTDDHAMRDLVATARMPMARWEVPGSGSLVLTQQAALSHTLHHLQDAPGLLAIHAPPGSGKEALLRDLVANVWTGRARRIAALAEPSDLFEAACTVEGKDFFPVKPALAADSAIVIAGSNSDDVSRLTHALSALLGHELASHFGDVMQASCGPARDDSVLPDEAFATWNRTMEAAAGEPLRYQGEWHAAKQRLLASIDTFERQRRILVDAEAASRHIDSYDATCRAMQTSIEAVHEEIAILNDTLARRRDEQAVQGEIVEAHRKALAVFGRRHAAGMFDRLLAWFGVRTQRLVRSKRAMDMPADTLAHATALMAKYTKDIARTLVIREARRRALSEQVSARAAHEAALGSHQQALQAGYDSGARYFANRTFWARPADERHRASIGTGPSLEARRSEIFRHAAELHRLTILANAGTFIANMATTDAVLRGHRGDTFAIRDRPLLWHALFFVVPVVAAPLASIARSFAGMGQESIGWLVLDDAGSATPASAAGAIWRSRRVVVLGDPLQIEPSFSVPRHIVDAVRRRHAVSRDWSPTYASVQMLADRVTPLGAWISSPIPSSNGDARRLWSGLPLRAMSYGDAALFAAVNRIAYAGQMVGSETPTLPWLDESRWLSVRSDRVIHPVSVDEIDRLIEILDTLRDAPGQHDHRPAPAFTIIVTSPFRKVVEACRQRIGQTGHGHVPCGTLHDFAGQRADVVVLVLGTAAGRPGAEARAWAASRPHMLTTAISSARSRLYVIGDIDQWGSLDYFRDLRIALNASRAGAPRLQA